MRGDHINIEENKPALHTALRTFSDTPILDNHQNIIEKIIDVRQNMQGIVEKIRTKKWLGFSNKPVTDIVDIGIGGSVLSPRFALSALSAFSLKDIGYHSISNAEPSSFSDTVAN